MNKVNTYHIPSIYNKRNDCWINKLTVNVSCQMLSILHRNIDIYTAEIYYFYRSKYLDQYTELFSLFYKELCLSVQILLKYLTCVCYEVAEILLIFVLSNIQSVNHSLSCAFCFEIKISLLLVSVCRGHHSV